MEFSSDPKLLMAAARRAASRPEFLAAVFAEFAKAEKKTESEMARLLGATEKDYAAAGLSLRPRAGFYAEDLEQIAIQWKLDLGRLSYVVRHVEVLAGMKHEASSASVSDQGLLMAARVRSIRKNPPAPEA